MPLKTTTPLGSRPPAAHAAKLSPEEFRARLQAYFATRKAGPITTVPVALEQSKHTEMMAILKQQTARVEMRRSAILAEKITPRTDTSSSVASPSPAPARGGPAAPVSAAGKGIPGSAQGSTVSHLPIPCGEPNIATVNGLPPPQQSFGASGGKGGNQPGNVRTASQNVPQFSTATPSRDVASKFNPLAHPYRFGPAGASSHGG